MIYLYLSLSSPFHLIFFPSSQTLHSSLLFPSFSHSLVFLIPVTSHVYSSLFSLPFLSLHSFAHPLPSLPLRPSPLSRVSYFSPLPNVPEGQKVNKSGSRNQPLSRKREGQRRRRGREERPRTKASEKVCCKKKLTRKEYGDEGGIGITNFWYFNEYKKRVWVILTTRV